MPIIDLNKENFDSIIDENDLVLVDFWAEWCAPCKTFGDVYAECAKQYPEVIFGKVDIQSQPELAQDFQVRSIPMLMVIRQGTAVFCESGSMPLGALSDLIEQAKALDITQLQDPSNKAN